jgi:dTDP-4-amino-4,6-dideoxygalactose transaminase
LQQLELKYKVRILLDNCENTLGLYKNKNISSYFTSTTSTYFGHQLQSVEGGFIFTNDEEEYEYFLMNRNHGMTRSLAVYDIDASRYNNPEVNKLFDFYSLGNNFRNTDIHAFIGLLDFNRIQSYSEKRLKVYDHIKNVLEGKDLILPINFKNRTAVPFCFPFLSKDLNLIKKLMNFCKENHIEIRPIISGNLLKQTCYKKYDDYRNFKNSEFLHTHGFYIGIYPKLSDKQINILKNFNDLFGNIDWSDKDRIAGIISKELPAKVASDERFINAKNNSDKQNAKIEHDAALQRVMNSLMQDQVELFKQFMNNEDFKKWLQEEVFKANYESVA